MNIMVDLETLGKGPNAAIIAVGAVAFTEGEVTEDTFYGVVDPETSVRSGGEIDASTVLWWMKQSDEARAAVCKPGKPQIEVLLVFATWLENFKGRKVWGNGATFDNVILAQAYRRSHLEVPWEFWNDRCFRTLKDLRPALAMKRIGTAHNALDDARTQAAHAVKIFKELGR